VTAWVAVLGWVTAALAGGLAAGWRWRLGQRLEAVAQASHEVRGPLAAARLAVSLGERVGRLAPARLRALDQELERAARAVADLDAARQGWPTPRLEPGPVDIQRLLADSVRAWEAAAQDRSAQLVLGWSGQPVTVWGDRVRLAQAVGNLIANAVEHGAGRVEVRGSAWPDGVRIEVRDRGPGLGAPLSVLARSRQRSDRGRGLAIAGAVAARHGGRLAAAPSDSGARLVLTLPRGVSDPPAEVSGA
jgi:signal transduction histidine kinase